MFSVTLLTTNSKLNKSNKRFQNVLNVGLAMAPHNRSGHNVCPAAGYCSAVCLAWFSGRTVTSTVRNAMLNRTQWLFSEPVSFHKALDRELQLLGIRPVKCWGSLRGGAELAGAVGLERAHEKPGRR